MSLLEKKWGEELYAKAAKELSVGSASCYSLLKSLQNWKGRGLCCVVLPLSSTRGIQTGCFLRCTEEFLGGGKKGRGLFSLLCSLHPVGIAARGGWVSRKFMDNGKKMKGGSFFFLPCQLWPWQSVQQQNKQAFILLFLLQSVFSSEVFKKRKLRRDLTDSWRKDARRMEPSS